MTPVPHSVKKLHHAFHIFFRRVPMRSIIAGLVCLAIGFSCSPKKSEPQTAARIKTIERGLVQFTIPMMMLKPDTAGVEVLRTFAERMAYYKVPGVSIAVIDNNTIDWVKGYGMLKAGGDTPVTTESMFQAASTSKLLTAVMALHFVQEGALDLDEDVNNYLTSWKVPQNEFTRERKVTLRLLLTHQAGLPATNFSNEEHADYPSLIQVLDGEPPALNNPAVVEYVPGSKWQYSNLGCLVIQKILEDVAEKPFADLADEIIFKPLGMGNSTFSYPLLPDDQVREAMPHDDQGIAREPAMHFTALAHAGLMTTPSDLARITIELMRAYTGESASLLSKESARQLFHRELDLDPRLFGVPLGEGLGVLLYGEEPDFMFVHPGSNLPGTNCWLVGLPESGRGAVVMTNGMMGELLGMDIITAINKAYRWAIDHPPTL
jgi:CubicO group peptidase (beta-lactamase class C family)